MTQLLQVEDRFPSSRGGKRATCSPPPPLFILHRRSFQMQFLILHQLPLFFRCKLRRATVRYLLGLKHLTHSVLWQQRVFLREPGPGLRPFPLLLFTAQPPLPPPSSFPLCWGLMLCCHGDSHMGVLLLFVFQVQTLYYSPDHKLVDGGLVIEGHSEVFGGEEDHLQFVQVLNSLCLDSL